MREIVVFSGSAHRELAKHICAELAVELSPSRSSGSATTACRRSCSPTAASATYIVQLSAADAGAPHGAPR